MRWLLVVLLAGVFAAGPFLSSRGLGTAEAYNYSLSVADAVTQFRAGVLPVLTGQTEFAFNGRVHPLRTAPYMAYLAGTLDVLTFRQLSFWSLQNLALALSLIGGAFACFWTLRRVTPATPATAAALSAVYMLSPAVLAAAYGMDLYMTVMTVPFVPLVIAANVASFDQRRIRVWVLLSMILAACWLAHPPVALWMTTITLLLQIIAAGVHPIARREWPALGGAALLFSLLAAFAFASALTIFPYPNVTQHNDVSGLLHEVSRNFAASLRPVSVHADQLGDFQLGYAVSGLALVGIGLGVRRRNGTALSLLLVAALLYVLTAPVPGLTRWLWTHAPGAVFNLTSQWPMQRLYLPMTVLVIFAFALVWRPPVFPTSVLRDAGRILLACVLVWSAWQGWRFVGRGFESRHSQLASPHNHRSGGIDLTVISYALLGAPGSFVHGVMDPGFEFRLLAPYDAHEAASNWTAPLPPSPENRSGTLLTSAGEASSVLELEPDIVLQPGAHYRLTFAFNVPPDAATLQLRGRTLFREYTLPAAGNARGFGMNPGNTPGLTLWTNESVPETVHLRLVAPNLANGSWRDRPFAEYHFEKIEDAALPLELKSLLPLRVRVRALAAAYLETPRMFIDGYKASVNGSAVRVQPSPEGLVMLPVPAGVSQVEVRYVGPLMVRASFWLACLGWSGLVVWGTMNCRPARPRAWPGPRFSLLWARVRTAVVTVPRPWWLGAVAMLLLLIGVAAGWRTWDEYRKAVGPIRIRFVLPRGETNRQQPLLVTGQPHAGTFIYAVYADADHIRLGVDVWGLLGAQTDPIKVDYFAEHEVVIDAGALYPIGHPALRHLPPDALARLRNHLSIKFDGQTVLQRAVDTYDSSVRDVTVGRNAIGGSACEPRFVGRILAVQRLPIPDNPR